MKKIFRNFLSYPILVATILFFICMVSTAFGSREVTISWDSNTEEDIEGYAVYLQEEALGPPFELLVALPVDEMMDPETPIVTLTELEPGSQYYIAVTAYDSQGNESAFSDELCIQVLESSILQCASASGGNGGGDGGHALRLSPVDGDRYRIGALLVVCVRGGHAERSG